MHSLPGMLSHQRFLPIPLYFYRFAKLTQQQNEPLSNDKTSITAGRDKIYCKYKQFSFSVLNLNGC